MSNHLCLFCILEVQKIDWRVSPLLKVLHFTNCHVRNQLQNHYGHSSNLSFTPWASHNTVSSPRSEGLSKMLDFCGFLPRCQLGDGFCWEIFILIFIVRSTVKWQFIEPLSIFSSVIMWFLDNAMPGWIYLWELDWICLWELDLIGNFGSVGMGMYKRKRSCLEHFIFVYNIRDAVSWSKLDGLFTSRKLC